MALFTTTLLGLLAFAFAGTPSNMIGVWRGLPIQHKYNTEREEPIPLVEWEMKFAEDTVVIKNQHGTSTFKVSSSETGQLTMTGDTTLNCAYSMGGDHVEVTELSVGCGTPGFTPEAGKPEQCMPGGTFGACVNLWKCIDGKHCKFSATRSVNTNIWTQGGFDMTDDSTNGITGTWRGTQISDNYASGEWDFTFFSNGTLAYVNQAGGAVDYGSWKESVVITTEGTTTSFTFASHSGKVYKGFYTISSSTQVKTMNLAWGAVNGDAPSGFDDAMQNGAVWINMACPSGEANCDFSSSVVSALASSLDRSIIV